MKLNPPKYEAGYQRLQDQPAGPHNGIPLGLSHAEKSGGHSKPQIGFHYRRKIFPKATDHSGIAFEIAPEEPCRATGSTLKMTIDPPM
jgi:hypothetical protein